MLIDCACIAKLLVFITSKLVDHKAVEFRGLKDTWPESNSAVVALPDVGSVYFIVLFASETTAIWGVNNANPWCPLIIGADCPYAASAVTPITSDAKTNEAILI